MRSLLQGRNHSPASHCSSGRLLFNSAAFIQLILIKIAVDVGGTSSPEQKIPCQCLIDKMSGSQGGSIQCDDAGESADITSMSLEFCQSSTFANYVNSQDVTEQCKDFCNLLTCSAMVCDSRESSRNGLMYSCCRDSPTIIDDALCNLASQGKLAINPACQMACNELDGYAYRSTATFAMSIVSLILAVFLFATMIFSMILKMMSGV